MNFGPRSGTTAEVLRHLQENVRVDGDCRIWAGCVTSDDTPRVFWRGRGWRATRLLWMLMHGYVPDSTRVWARCGNKLCMSPAHLRATSHAAHVAFMAREGRFPTGTRRKLASGLGHANRAKLGIRDRADVARMRGEGLRYADIAQHYGVTASCVGHYVRRWIQNPL